MLMLPARTFTDPALPEEDVLEEIWPPFTRITLPVADTSKFPAFPELPALASLEMPVKSLLPCPSMLMLPALTFTDPALPDERVLESITPPLKSET